MTFVMFRPPELLYFGPHLPYPPFSFRPMERALPELLAPARDETTLTSALEAGADAVYFGVGSLNMRSRSARNFEPSDLEWVVKRCRYYNARAYLTLNTIVDNSIGIIKTTDVVEFQVSELRKDDQPVRSASKREQVTIPVPRKVRPSDHLYKWVKREGA